MPSLTELHFFPTRKKKSLTSTHVSKVNYYLDIDSPTITDWDNTPRHLACEACCWCLASDLVGKRPRREASRRLIRTRQSSWTQCYPPEEDQQIFFPCCSSHVISPAPPRTFLWWSPPSLSKNNEAISTFRHFCELGKLELMQFLLKTGHSLKHFLGLSLSII